MALKRLTTDEMVQISGAWVTHGNPAQKKLGEVPVLAGLVEHVMAAHQGLLDSRPEASDQRLAEIVVESTALDLSHDNAIRGSHMLLSALELLAETEAQAQMMRELRDFLLPDGLEHTQATYRGEAGAAERLATRLSDRPDVKKQLKDIGVGKKSLVTHVQGWIDDARALGTLEDEKAAIMAKPSEGAGAKQLAARNAWIRTVNALLSVAELAELDPATDQLLFGPLRLAEKTADRRGRPAPKAAAPEPTGVSSGETPVAEPA